LTNARLKVVFGGLIDEDLDILARELYTGEFNPDEIKDEIWQTKFRPVETTRVIHSTGWGDSSGTVTHQSLSSGEVCIPGSDFFSPSARSYSSGSGSGSGRSESSSSSGSEVRVPFYEFHEFRELSSRTFRSLEEQLYIKKAQMKREPRQHAAVLIPDSPVHLIEAATLREISVPDRERDNFLLEAMENSRCFTPPEQAAAEIADAEQKLLEAAQPVIEVRATEKTGAKRRQKQESKSTLARAIEEDQD
jgi:hypothetical protein